MATITSTEEVYDYIIKNEGKTKKELALLMGLGATTFLYHYRKLLKAKRIEKIDDLTVVTGEVLKLLEYYFTMGLTDEQACYKAKIKVNTFYNYCRENPEWADLRNVLKDDTVINAKIQVAEKVKAKDDGYTKMVYTQEKMRDRASVKVSMGSTETVNEEEVNSKNVSLKVTFLN